MKNLLKNLHGHLNYHRTLRLNGQKYSVPVIHNMGLLNLKVSHDWISDLFARLDFPAESVFIDVGANVGQTLLQFRSASQAGYIGFEPNPSCAYYLRQLIAVNNIRKASVIPVGLSTENTVLKFYQKNPSDSAGTIVPGLRPDYYSEQEASFVPVYAFDDLNLELPGAVALVKIDVEGAELAVIKGMRKMLARHRPPVICEILDAHSAESLHEMQRNADELIALVQSLAYDVYRIRRGPDKTFLEKADKLTLVQWTERSYDMNDYLFWPAGREINF